MIGEVDLDADVRAGVLELALELDDAGLEHLDAPLEGEGAVVGRRLEGRDRRRRGRVVEGEILDDDPVAGLVGGLERLLEAPEARLVESEVVGHLVELRALFLRDDPVLDHLGEELLVHRLELAEPHVAGDLAELEALAVLERRVRVVHPTNPFPGHQSRAGRGAAQRRSSGRRAGRRRGLAPRPRYGSHFGCATRRFPIA